MGNWRACRLDAVVERAARPPCGEQTGMSGARTFKEDLYRHGSGISVASSMGSYSGCRDRKGACVDGERRDRPAPRRAVEMHPVQADVSVCVREFPALPSLITARVRHPVPASARRDCHDGIESRRAAAGVCRGFSAR